jgi:hypothetical protein
MCVANPEKGSAVLSEIEPSEWFSGELERQAAVRLKSNIADPLAGLNSDDQPELSALIAALLSSASIMDPSPASFELEHAQLDLRRHDRLIDRARRSDPGSASALASSRELIRRRLDKAADALEDENDLRLS